MGILGKTILICSFTIAMLSAAPEANAVDMEYYTYNGFGAVVTAFQKISLIF